MFSAPVVAVVSSVMSWVGMFQPFPMLCMVLIHTFAILSCSSRVPGSQSAIKASFCSLIGIILLYYRLFYPVSSLFLLKNDLFFRANGLSAVTNESFANVNRPFSPANAIFATVDRLFAVADVLFAMANRVFAETNTLFSQANGSFSRKNKAFSLASLLLTDTASIPRGSFAVNYFK
jgi:hypothetical protein